MLEGMLRRLISTLIPFWLLACVSAQELDDRLNIWVGKDSDDLATSWGAPSGTYEKKDGGSILSYERMAIVTTGAAESQSTSSRTCRIDFTTDAEGKIVTAKWQGAADQCDRSIP